MSRCGYCDIFTGAAQGPPIALDTPGYASFMGRYQPTGPGYALVVPKRHVADLHAFEASELGPMLEAVQRVSAAILDAFSVTGTTVMQNNGEPGQRVRHVHFHVVPRWPGDTYPSDSVEAMPITELERQAELLRASLR